MVAFHQQGEQITCQQNLPPQLLQPNPSPRNRPEPLPNANQNPPLPPVNPSTARSLPSLPPVERFNQSPLAPAVRPTAVRARANQPPKPRKPDTHSTFDRDLNGDCYPVVADLRRRAQSTVQYHHWPRE